MRCPAIGGRTIPRRGVFEYSVRHFSVCQDDVFQRQEQPRFDPHELIAERIAHLYRPRKSAWTMQAVGAGLMALVLSSALPLVALAWLAAFALAHAFQWAVGRGVTAGLHRAQSVQTMWVHRLAALGVGASWGAAGLALPHLPPERGVMVLVLIVIAVAMNLPRLAALPEAFSA